MSAWRRGPQQLISQRGSHDPYRLADLDGERLRGGLGEEEPVYRLNIIIIVRPIEHGIWSGRPAKMGVRNRRGMPVIRIAAMQVRERRLSEAQ